MRLPSGTSMTLTGPSLTPSRLSVVLLDLGLWLEFLELGFNDSLLGDCNQEGKQIQYKLINLAKARLSRTLDNVFSRVVLSCLNALRGWMR